MNQLNYIERAKGGDAQAIAFLLNRSLAPKGITVKANIKVNCLRIMLESSQVLSQPAMVKFVHQGLKKLQPDSIKTVTIYGKQTHLDFPTWSQELNLDESPQPILNHSPPEESNSMLVICPGEFDQNIEHTEKTTHQNHVDGKLETPNVNLSDTTVVTAQMYQTPEIANSLSKASPKSKYKRPKIPIPKQISRVLIAVIGLEICFNSFFVIYAVVWATSYYIYDLLDVADTTGILIYLIHRLVIFIDGFWNPLELISDWTYTIIFLLSLVWLHRVHAYLRSHEPDYPITPWGAVARFAIPFYSLWGIWNTLNTLAQRLKQEAKLAHLGTSLSRWIPWLYITLFGSNILDQMYWHGVNNGNQNSFYPWLFFAYASTTLFLSLVWLKIVRIIWQVIAKTGNRQ
ncbi:MAG: hypothetical protein RH949_09600 [Coleofasciculus sp. A1-SPW-01]|uniref:hypothetical protein n=1 Tax=Coleofasciculus sp. A1-SPW-01 TaxID=3070819 RepID=UPI003300BD2A